MMPVSWSSVDHRDIALADLAYELAVAHEQIGLLRREAELRREICAAAVHALHVSEHKRQLQRVVNVRLIVAYRTLRNQSVAA